MMAVGGLLILAGSAAVFVNEPTTKRAAFTTGASVLAILIPAALGLGLLGLAAFLWSLKSGQYEDLDGAAERILMDDEDRPAT